jgi:leucine dehydrogenase
MKLEHEQLIVRQGRRSGAHVIVAVHSTALGPALGGCRMWRYDGVDDAVQDALRLSAAMTLKAAAAGLPLGGGKGVICLPPGVAPTGRTRTALLHDFADAVNLLDGAYITAEDVGTDSRDMVTISQRTRHVVGLPAASGGSGDPSPFTAAGVHAAIRACVRHSLGTSSLEGRSVAIIGCGHVGAHLARRLAAAGARLLLADVDDAKRALVDELPGAQWAEPDAALNAQVDVLAPCALGGVLDLRAVEDLRCRIVCGAANNQLADGDVATALHARGILYAPDFIVNAGGLINVSMELERYDAKLAARRAEAIEEVFDTLLAEASAAGTTPLEAAIRRADARLGRAVASARRSLVPAA